MIIYKAKYNNEIPNRSYSTLAAAKEYFTKREQDKELKLFMLDLDEVVFFVGKLNNKDEYYSIGTITLNTIDTMEKE